MPAFRFKSFAKPSAVASLALALAILALPRAGFAYTQEEQQACTPDAMRLCSEFIPNVDAITACMIKKKAQLSPQCAVFFRRGPEPGQARAGKPTSIAPKKASTTAKKTAKPATKKKSSQG
ncbi:hypothetical protein HZZ13_11820 [Bradyrhizobium sp. CNPSo 4010]|uniref:Cysteine rich repeat-containing protein n=1 Tax=Bradyrhizobium agreste TaxID=2751811 RepID=A0ABS0PND3_9BRAD|nr:hypothetical protein [Bradyrhizobium agreste]MBH5398471.1 hypothetical protein [Bradyrhizobium agreste]